MNEEDRENIAEVAYYHQCIAERALKTAKSDIATDIEKRAALGAHTMHTRWADSLTKVANLPPKLHRALKPGDKIPSPRSQPEPEPA